MQSKDLDEAIRFYNNSLSIYSEEPTTYCNRALAYIKLKQFEKGLNDCDKAIEIKSDYAKAYYRRAMCLSSLSMYRKALDDLLFILCVTPNSPEVLQEVKNLKEKWRTHLGRDDWVKLNMEKEIEDEVDKANKGEHPILIKKSMEKSEVNKNINNNNNTTAKTETKAEPSSNSNASTNANSNTKTKASTFKKMKIVEENPEPVVTKKEEEEIDQELSKINKFLLYLYKFARNKIYTIHSIWRCDQR